MVLLTAVKFASVSTPAGIASSKSWKTAVKPVLSTPVSQINFQAQLSRRDLFLSTPRLCQGLSTRWTLHPTSDAAGLKSMLPSTSEPIKSTHGFDKLKRWQKQALDDGDRGYLAFTKASLFKLTLPLAPPDLENDPSSPISKASSLLAPSISAKAVAKDSAQADGQDHEAQSERDSRAIDPEPWESRVERGKTVSHVESEYQTGNIKRKEKGGTTLETIQRPEQSEPADDRVSKFDAKAPTKSVVFLLHSGQPLSYIASLIRAENPSYSQLSTKQDGAIQERTPMVDTSMPNPQTYEPAITFHTRTHDGKRWSSATGIGDFLRDAARIGTFFIQIGERNVKVSVPSFEDRTRFLRASLYSKTALIEQMAQLKAECDALAKTGTRRFAIAGAGLGVSWWLLVLWGSFFSPSMGGWDFWEPVTYLTGLGGLICGYSWFLIHNRDVSYRAVLSETTSRRQQQLYLEKGVNMEKYQELIDEVRQLRKAIKTVAEEYDLEWDQGETANGKRHKKALNVVRKTEAINEQQQSGSTKRKARGEGHEAPHEDDEDTLDEEADETPDGQQKVTNDKEGRVII